MSAVAHPSIKPAEFRALQASSAWRLAVELIAGEAVVMPPTGGYAASVQGELFFALRTWQETASDGGLLLQDVFIALPGEQFLAPDIAWWSSEHRPALTEGALAVVPDLVVEILSPATPTNDLGVKRELYIDSGVRELWLADPAGATVTIVRPNRQDEIVRTGQSLRSGLFAGLGVDLGRIFSR